MRGDGQTEARAEWPYSHRARASGRSADQVVDDDPELTAARLGRRRFIGGIGAAAGAAAGVGVLGTALVASGSAAASVPAGASVFVPLARQTRFADTRHPDRYPFTRLTPTRISVQVTGREAIPANATAAVVTLTAINKDDYNFVTIYPGGTPVPEASNLNMAVFDEVAANLATVQLGANGAVEVDAFAACEMIVDVAGYYVPVNGITRAGRFVALATPRRAIDTRNTKVLGGGESVVVDCTSLIPSDASSVVINLTTTGTFGWGFFTCYPLDTDVVPESSNLNVNGPFEERAAAAVVKVTTVNGVRGFKVWTYSGGHVLVDVLGYYTGPTSPASTDGLFVPIAPLRILDTRKPGTIGKLWKDWVVESPVPAPANTSAQAIVANLTAVDCRAPGWFTAFAAGTYWQDVSSVNADTANETIPNHIISRISDRGIAVYAQWGAHILVDMAGWFTGAPAAAIYPPPVNPPPPPIEPPWRLEVPSVGINSWVYAGSNSYAVVNRGHSWHWTGTGYVGQDAHVAVFAHRTEYGGVYRYMHFIKPGDEINVYTSDGRKYRYRMVRRDVTSARTTDILDGTRRHPGTTFSLIACSKLDGSPTSLTYRLIVTGALEGWEPV